MNAIFTIDNGFIRSFLETIMKTLEAKSGFVEVSCGNCLQGLQVPSQAFEQILKARENNDSSILGKEYDGFFVSRETALVGSLGYYCNRQCHNIRTED